MFEDWPDSPGIYLITCVPAGKSYVGRAVSLRARLRQHFRHLLEDRHHSKKMQADFNAYGVFSFDVQILEELPRRCSDKALGDLEAVWTDKLKPVYGGARFKPSDTLVRLKSEVVKREVRLIRKLKQEVGDRSVAQRLEAKEAWLLSLPDEMVSEYPGKDYRENYMRDWLDSLWFNLTGSRQRIFCKNYGLCV